MKTLAECNKGDRIIWDGQEHEVTGHYAKLGRTTIKPVNANDKPLGGFAVLSNEVGVLSSTIVSIAA